MMVVQVQDRYVLEIRKISDLRGRMEAGYLTSLDNQELINIDH